MLLMAERDNKVVARLLLCEQFDHVVKWHNVYTVKLSDDNKVQLINGDTDKEMDISGVRESVYNMIIDELPMTDYDVSSYSDLFDECFKMQYATINKTCMYGVNHDKFCVIYVEFNNDEDQRSINLVYDTVGKTITVSSVDENIYAILAREMRFSSSKGSNDISDLAALMNEYGIDKAAKAVIDNVSDAQLMSIILELKGK